MIKLAKLDLTKTSQVRAILTPKVKTLIVRARPLEALQIKESPVGFGNSTGLEFKKL